MATKATPAPSPSPQRAALAAALADREMARRNLADARSASRKAFDLWDEAESRLEALKLEADETRAQTPDRMIAALTGDTVLELTRAEAELRDRIAAAEQEVEAYHRARDVAEKAIPTRQASFDWAQSKVVEAAKAVMAAEVDVASLLAAAAKEEKAILGRRAELLQLLAMLPGDSEERKAIAAFMARPWLEAEFGDGWKANPAGAPYRQAFAALLEDAAA